MLEHVKGNPNSALTGPLLVDEDGVPRFWALVWAIYETIGAASSLEKKLRYIEAFYRHSREISDPSLLDLDSAVARMDIGQLTSLLQAYYVHVANSNPITPASQYKWSSAIKFVLALAKLRLNAPSSSEEIDLVRAQIAQLTLINQPLYSYRQARPTRVRALPAEVVDHLYGVLDPTSKKNPFRRLRTIWNAWILFILFLHEGMRRGEILSAPSNTIFSGTAGNSGQRRFWIRIKSNQYEEDTRYSKPCHKNEFTPRTLPIAQNLAHAVDEYVDNYRGKPNHSFLINSSWDTALSTESVTHIFGTISEALPVNIRKVLRDHTDCESITPHDLRHTCAVLRLNQFLNLGIDRETAIENLRVLFGWSKDSTMPLLYARAVFESSLADVWRKNFDDRVDVLRALLAERAFPESADHICAVEGLSRETQSGIIG